MTEMTNELPKFFLNPADVARLTELGNIVKDENGVTRVVNVPCFSGMEVVEVGLLDVSSENEGIQ